MEHGNAGAGGIRARVLRTLRGVYRALRRTPLGPLLAAGPVQRMRKRLHVGIEEADVLEVLDALAAAPARAWLAGGWGADALAGRQTRPHGDLDLVVAAEDEERALAALARLGFARIPGAAGHVPDALLPDRAALQDPRGRVVDLHPIDPATWPARPDVGEAFTTGVVAGRTVPCLTVAAQLAAHEGYELESEDHHDLDLLRAAGAARGAG